MVVTDYIDIVEKNFAHPFGDKRGCEYAWILYRQWIEARPFLLTNFVEWVKPDGERVAMHDEDPAFSKVESDNCKRLVTLQSYKITDNARVAFSVRTATDGASLPRHG